MGVRQRDDKLFAFPGNRNVLGVYASHGILHVLDSGIAGRELDSPGRNEPPRTRAGAQNKSKELTQTFQVQEGPAFLDHHF